MKPHFFSKAFLPSSAWRCLLLGMPLALLWSCGPVDATPVAPKDDLNGTWETPCFLVPGQQLKSKTRLVYNSLKLTGSYTDYADADCKVVRGASTWTGTATVGAAGAAAGSKKLDLSFDSYKYKPVVAEAATVNNQYMYCGFMDWVANVEKDVLGRACFGFSIPVGGKSFDLYKVEGNTLKFGKDSKISASPQEADRPSVIDENRVFTLVSP
jgi:hypothetical protein